jgi:hypothetical protein
MDWQTLANIAAVGGAASAGAAFLFSLWFKRRAEALRRLKVRMDRLGGGHFELVVEYEPSGKNQALYADLASPPSTQVHLVARPYVSAPPKSWDEAQAGVTWPKRSYQRVRGHLRPVAGSDALRASFRVVPQFTNAAGWFRLQIYTLVPNRRTVLRRRIPVSAMNE